MLTYERVKNDPEIRKYIMAANEALDAIGFNEHSFPHVTRVAETASGILASLGYSERECEIAKITGFVHDIGNLVNRADHAHSGAMMAFMLLRDMGADPTELAAITSAIGNHDENTASPVSALAAALILADKSDVRRSRVVDTGDVANFDIHDRVNYSVIHSVARVSDDKAFYDMDLVIDTAYGSVMEYFEIFTGRMALCRRAAAKLGLRFRLRINGQQLL